ncbi:hypothetical protein [Kytococcus sedentarius]|uniref:hypothetical protein n=1 Tax=Kytococcus sedentarius TaxID=1276 RepID=UPI0035BC593B
MGLLEWQRPLFWVAFVLALLGGAVAVLGSIDIWRVDPGKSVTASTSIAALNTPLTAAIAGWATRSLLVDGRADWLHSTGRLGRMVALGALVPALLSLLVGLGAMATTMALGPGQHVLPWVPGAVIALLLSALTGGVVGAGVALLWRHPLAPVVTMVALWTATAFATDGFVEVFATGGGLGEGVGRQYSPEIVTIRAAVAALLAGSVLLMAWAARSGATTLLRLSGLAPLLVLLGVGAVVNGVDEIESDPSAEATECAGLEPVVCVLPGHERFLPSAQEAAENLYALDLPVEREAVMVITELPPDRIQEVSDSEEPRPLTSRLSTLWIEGSGRVSIAASWASPPECGMAVPSPQALAAETPRARVINWIATGKGERPSAEEVEAAFTC